MATNLAMQATPFAKCHPRIHGIDDSELEDASGVTEERSWPPASIRTPFAGVHMAKWSRGLDSYTG